MTGAPDPNRLRAVPRAENRARLGLEPGAVPFDGGDRWTAYELSWLGPRGRPEVRIAHLSFPCRSDFLIESKSLKLYLGAFSEVRFASAAEVTAAVGDGLSFRAGAAVSVRLETVGALEARGLAPLPGTCIDDLDVECTDRAPAPERLAAEPSAVVRESLHSHLLKSSCPETGQPDWGSVLVRYAGPRLDRAGLLRYLISFREHAAFHEHCVERMFVDIAERCRPDRLLVSARYLRRGGLDINPYRSSDGEAPDDARLARQ